MRSAENKYLKTISRVFGPAVEKAMPVMLKVAFGSLQYDDNNQRERRKHRV